MVVAIDNLKCEIWLVSTLKSRPRASKRKAGRDAVHRINKRLGACGRAGERARHHIFGDLFHIPRRSLVAGRSSFAVLDRMHESGYREGQDGRTPAAVTESCNSRLSGLFFRRSVAGWLIDSGAFGLKGARFLNY